MLNYPSFLLGSNLRSAVLNSCSLLTNERAAKFRKIPRFPIAVSLPFGYSLDQRSRTGPNHIIDTRSRRVGFRQFERVDVFLECGDQAATNMEDFRPCGGEASSSQDRTRLLTPKDASNTVFLIEDKLVRDE